MDDKPCPKCSGVMVFRLGQFECQDCGHIELPGPTKEELDERALNPFIEHPGGFQPRGDGINRRKLISPDGTPSAPPAAEPPPPIFREEPEWRDEDELNQRYAMSQALNAEKHTYMAVFLFVTLGVLVTHALINGNAGDMVSRLAGSVFLALLYTLIISVPLYYQWDLARQACLVLLVIQVLVFTGTVVVAVYSKMLGEAWYLIPQVFLDGWLFWILVRDRRGEAEISGSGCFWGTPSNWR